jgi:hypothetical protein
MPALDSTQDLLLEVNAAAALHVSDKLSIGGALRVGIGMFSTTLTTSVPGSFRRMDTDPTCGCDATRRSSGVGSSHTDRVVSTRSRATMSLGAK